MDLLRTAEQKKNKYVYFVLKKPFIFIIIVNEFTGSYMFP